MKWTTNTTSWIPRPLSVESRASQPARVTLATASTRGTRTAAAYTETTRLWMTRRSCENIQSIIVSTIGIWLVWRRLNFSVTSKGLILTRESSFIHEPLHSNNSMVPLKCTFATVMAYVHVLLNILLILKRYLSHFSVFVILGFQGFVNGII